MVVLIDANIVLDVLLNREPWVTDAAQLWRLCDERSVTGYISASSFTDYLVTRDTQSFKTSAVATVTASELLQRWYSPK